MPLFLLALPGSAAQPAAHAPPAGESLCGAVRARRFWLLLALYAICGLQDFFVATHVVAFAQDRGLDALFAGNLLALMGLTGLIGVLAAGAVSDRTGPVAPTAAAFAARIAVFVLVVLDQSALSISLFALVYGATFLVTAPLTVVFVRDSFGMKNLGALSGLVTMVHQVFGGIGAYGGALVFDRTGSYDAALLLMLATTAVALVLTLMLRRPATSSAASARSSP
jgi:predicted MFS family arabinose efflux permease